MTARDAVQVLLAGYGDDCPDYRDEYIGALLALGEVGLGDRDDHRDRLATTWPRPQSILPPWMDDYVAALQDPPLLLSFLTKDGPLLLSFLTKDGAP
jgi:hypothetical protein